MLREIQLSRDGHYCTMLAHSVIRRNESTCNNSLDLLSVSLNLTT